ncbi:MAG: phosphatidylserine decarboxylase family protein [Ghiorsea sp.]
MMNKNTILRKPNRGNARGVLPVAPDGYPFIIGLAIVTLVCMNSGWLILSITFGILFLFTLNFFRDFEQDIPQEEGVFVSPANGKVIRAESDNSVARIDIFMNIFDIHVNRAPMSGTIDSMEYVEGQFKNANFEKACDENERNKITLKTDDGVRISFVQISGLVARRIVTYVKIGDKVKVGQRIGMIRFGSRVDSFIPAGFELAVNIGDKVVAGKTILARRKV